jgi:hypothetical protein
MGSGSGSDASLDIWSVEIEPGRNREEESFSKVDKRGAPGFGEAAGAVDGRTGHSVKRTNLLRW